MLTFEQVVEARKALITVTEAAENLNEHGRYAEIMNLVEEIQILIAGELSEEEQEKIDEMNI